MNTNKSLAIIIGLLLIAFFVSLALALFACETPTPPTSPVPTPPVSPLPTPVSPIATPASRAIEPQAIVGEVITGAIAVTWHDDNLGLKPQEVMSSGIMTTALYIDLELRLEDGSVLSQTIDTDLTAPDVEGSGQFNGDFIYEWQDVPVGQHPEYVRLRWEIESSDVIVVQADEYVPYTETIYGTLVLNGQVVQPDAAGFALYRVVEVRQVYYYYLPLIMSNVP